MVLLDGAAVVSDPFRYYPHEGERHAIPAGSLGGQVTVTLCEQELTVDADRKLGFEKTCAACESAWRTAANIPQQSQRQAPLSDTPTRSRGRRSNAVAGRRR